MRRRFDDALDERHDGAVFAMVLTALASAVFGTTSWSIAAVILSGFVGYAAVVVAQRRRSGK